MQTEEIITNSNKIQKNIQQIFKNHEEFIWKKTNDSQLPQLKYLNRLNFEFKQSKRD